MTTTNKIEQDYLSLLYDVLKRGEERGDRTGVGTRAQFGRQLRCHLKDGFPALTTKKLAFKACLGELLWFLEGSSDERRLAEITHGTREGRVTIWTPNSLAPYWKPKAKFEGDLGRVYGVQWRKWKHVEVKRGGEDSVIHYKPDGSVDAHTKFESTVTETTIDQIARIIHTLKTNPTDRRMVLTAFNVGELDQMALPPCHMFAQFYVSLQRKELSCQVYIRSNDLFLGLPFNIASYALLTHMLAQVTGYEPGELIITIGDAHVYNTHVDAVNEQLERAPRPPPTLKLTPHVSHIDDFRMDHFELVGYNPYPPIEAPMAV